AARTVAAPGERASTGRAERSAGGGDRSFASIARAPTQASGATTKSSDSGIAAIGRWAVTARACTSGRFNEARRPSRHPKRARRHGGADGGGRPRRERGARDRARRPHGERVPPGRGGG